MSLALSTVYEDSLDALITNSDTAQNMENLKLLIKLLYKEMSLNLNVLKYILSVKKRDYEQLSTMIAKERFRKMLIYISPTLGAK